MNSLPSEAICCICNYLDSKSLVNLRCVNREISYVCVNFIRLRDKKRNRSALIIINKIMLKLAGNYRHGIDDKRYIEISDQDGEVLIIHKPHEFTDLFDIFNDKIIKEYKYITHVYRLNDIIRKYFIKI